MDTNKPFATRVTPAKTGVSTPMQGVETAGTAAMTPAEHLANGGRLIPSICPRDFPKPNIS